MISLQKPSWNYGFGIWYGTDVAHMWTDADGKSRRYRYLAFHLIWIEVIWIIGLPKPDFFGLHNS